MVERVSFNLCSFRFHVGAAFSVGALNVHQALVDVTAIQREWQNLSTLDLVTGEGPIGILVGVDVIRTHEILDTKRPIRGTDGPWANLTPFG